MLESFKKFVEKCDDPYKVLSLSMEQKASMKSFLKNDEGVLIDDNEVNAEFMMNKIFPNDNHQFDTDVWKSVRRS